MHHQVSPPTTHAQTVHPSAFLTTPCLSAYLPSHWNDLAQYTQPLTSVLCCMEGEEAVLGTLEGAERCGGKGTNAPVGLQYSRQQLPAASHTNSPDGRTRYRHSPPSPNTAPKYLLLPITPSHPPSPIPQLTTTTTTTNDHTPPSTIHPGSPIPNTRASRTPPPPSPLIGKPAHAPQTHATKPPLAPSRTTLEPHPPSPV